MWEVQETDRPCEVEEAKALTLLKKMTIVIFGLILYLVKQHQVTSFIIDIDRVCCFARNESVIYIGYSGSTVCAYLSRILETVILRMCYDFLYQLRSHRRHFVKFVLCLCLFLYVKLV